MNPNSKDKNCKTCHHDIRPCNKVIKEKVNKEFLDKVVKNNIKLRKLQKEKIEVDVDEDGNFKEIDLGVEWA